MKKLLRILVALFLFCGIGFDILPASAQVSPTLPPLSSFLYGNTAVNAPLQTTLVAGAGFPFRVLLPRNYNPAAKYPLVIFLHGLGEVGTDGVAHLAAGGNTGHGALYLLSTANPDYADNYPCFFAAPQTPSGTVGWSSDVAATAVAQMINIVETQYAPAIDSSRIYLTGISMGGFGAYDQPYLQSLSTHMGYNPFACTVPLSGNMTGPRAPPSQPKIPIWSFHALNDPTVADATDEANVKALRALGYDVTHSLYNLGGHDIWEVGYQHPLILPWMFSQKMGQPSPGIPNNTAFLNGAFTNYGGTTTFSGVTINTTTTVLVESVFNVSQGKPVTVSSTEVGLNVAANAVDGNATTRWSSLYSDPQWITVDLGSSFPIAEIDLTWEVACGKNYLLQGSADGVTWTTLQTVTGNTTTGLHKYTFPANPTARYVRMYGTARYTNWGYSLFEFAVYSPQSS